MPDPDVVSEARDVGGFSKVVLEGLGTLRITQGDLESLTIEATRELMPRITSEVQGDTLKLGMRKGAWLKGLCGGDGTIKFRLTMKDIEEITLAGCGDVVSSGVRFDRLALTVSGTGSLRIENLEGSSLNVLVSGTGACDVSGDVRDQDVRITGAGSYAARSLGSKVAKATVSGAGSVVVSVEDTLDAHVSGAGSIRYYGEPTVFRRVTGVGSVEFAGA